MNSEGLLDTGIDGVEEPPTGTLLTKNAACFWPMLESVDVKRNELWLTVGHVIAPGEAAQRRRLRRDRGVWRERQESVGAEGELVVCTAAVMTSVSQSKRSLHPTIAAEIDRGSSVV